MTNVAFHTDIEQMRQNLNFENPAEQSERLEEAKARGRDNLVADLVNQLEAGEEDPKPEEEKKEEEPQPVAEEEKKENEENEENVEMEPPSP